MDVFVFDLNLDLLHDLEDCLEEFLHVLFGKHLFKLTSSVAEIGDKREQRRNQHLVL